MNFTIDFTQIILAVITLIGGLVVRYFIPWLKSVTSEKTYAILQLACQSAVYFAQQWYKTEDGEKKKEEAMKHAEEFLKARNITVDINLISECIEAELKKIKSTTEKFED